MQTQRLLLRPWHADDEHDAQALFKYASNPKIGPAAAWPTHRTIEDSRQALQTFLSQAGIYAVVLKQTEEPIGSIGLSPLSDFTGASEEERKSALELGYWVAEPYWGIGLIPEAAHEIMRYGFEDLGLHAIWGTHDINNVQSSRVMDKLGLRQLRIREHVHLTLLGEVYKDEAIRRITVEEWANLNSNMPGDTV